MPEKWGAPATVASKRVAHPAAPDGRHGRHGRPADGAAAARRAGALDGTLPGVTPVLVVTSVALYVAGLVLLAWEGRRHAAILLAAVGGIGLSVFTLP
jgi:hypothetical protein